MDEETLRVKRLFEALEKVERTSRLSIEHEITDMGTTAVEFLVAIMLDPEGENRYQAAKLLGKIAKQTRDPCLVEPMVKALGSPDFMIRQIAAQVLGILGDRRTSEVLVGALKDEKVMVQLWAVESLGKLGVPSAVGPLVELLQNTESSTLRHTIIRVLGTLGNPEVIPIILTFKDDEDSHVRARVTDAVQALRKNK
jgi:HEAT repeat protein